MNIRGKCICCQKEYYISIPTDRCIDCCFNPPEKRFWRNLKMLSWGFILISIPIFYIGYYGGMKLQLIITFSFIYGLFYHPLIRWVMEKF